jgi:cell division septation protein DedD
MGPNSFRNLTYAAVLLVVGSLVYLIYKSSKNKKLNPAMEASASASGLSTYSDTTALTGASVTPDVSTSSQDGSLVSSTASSAAGAAAMSPSTYNSKSKSSDEVKEVNAEEPGSLSGTGPSDAIASSEKKVNVKSGGGSSGKVEKMSIASKGVKTKAKFDAGNAKGDYMVVAGAFASKDNAGALVEKMKKMGFTKAEAVKMENSANTYAIAGYYEFKGGAEAAVRTLKANKVESLVKKRSGEIYHAAPAPVVAPKSPVKPAPKPVATNKPI